jgi:hypothetical protein
MACRGKCEYQITKIVNDPFTASVDMDPSTAPLVAGKKDDSDAADKVLRAKVAAWAAPVETTPCKDTVNCECHQTDDISDEEWKSKKILTRDFAHKFKSGGKNYEIKATIEYKIAYAAGACEEPKGKVFYVSAGSFPDLGVTVLADDEGVLTDAVLAKIRKALG